jgi:hypothetical protein
MNLRPDRRIDSVGGDQAIGIGILPAIYSYVNSVGILLERFHAVTRDQAPLWQLASKRLMEFGSMYAQGRGLKPRHRDRGDQLSTWTVEVELGDGFAAEEHLFEHPQGMQDSGCVWPKTHTRSDLSECRCPFIYRHIEACSNECKGRGQAAYSPSSYY